MIKSKKPQYTQEHESGIGIKLDYSDTYFENEILDSELESRLAQIGRERYRVSVEREENLKEARKNAENMQQLSEAIKQGMIGDSVSIYSGGKINKNEEKDKEKSGEVNIDELCDDVQRISTYRESDTESESKRSSAEPESEQPRRTLNTLTMFALSLQKFRTPIRNVQQGQVINETKTPDNMQNKGHSQRRQARSAFVRPSGPRAFSRLDRRPKSQRPMTMRRRRVKDGEVLEAADILPVMVQEINIHQRKQSRSRRELQELSKMEQKEKSLKIDRELERKKKLFNWAKGDTGLEQRIRTFVKDCDEFSRKRQPHELVFDSPRRSRTIVY